MLQERCQLVIRYRRRRRGSRPIGVYGGFAAAHASNSIFCFHPSPNAITVAHGIAKTGNYGRNDTRIGTVTPDGQLTMQGIAFGFHAVVTGRFTADEFVRISDYGFGACEYDWVLKKVGKGSSG